MTALQDKILKRKLKKREKQKLKVIQDRAKPGQALEEAAGSGAEEEQNRYYSSLERTPSLLKHLLLCVSWHDSVWHLWSCFVCIVTTWEGGQNKFFAFSRYMKCIFVYMQSFLCQNFNLS